MRSVGAIGAGLIGSKPVTRLGAQGSEAVGASASSGADTVPAEGEGLAQALEGASVVVDVSNSPASDDAAVLEFFETSVAYFGDVEHSFRLVPNARSG